MVDSDSGSSGLPALVTSGSDPELVGSAGFRAPPADETSSESEEGGDNLWCLLPEVFAESQRDGGDVGTRLLERHADRLVERYGGDGARLLVARAYAEVEAAAERAEARGQPKARAKAEAKATGQATAKGGAKAETKARAKAKAGAGPPPSAAAADDGGAALAST